MSNYNSLKTTIDANIKQNGRQEIKGQTLNSVLNEMVTTLGAEYQFAGVATLDPATDPGTPDAKVFYIANGKGSYTNFGGLEVTEDDVVVLYWDSSWHKVSTGIASNEKLTELESDLGEVEEEIYDYLEQPLVKDGTLEQMLIFKNTGVIGQASNASYKLDYYPVKAGDKIIYNIRESLSVSFAVLAFSKEVPNDLVETTVLEVGTDAMNEYSNSIVIAHDGYLIHCNRQTELVSINKVIIDKSNSIVKKMKEDIVKLEGDMFGIEGAVYIEKLEEVLPTNNWKTLDFPIPAGMITNITFNGGAFDNLFVKDTQDKTIKITPDKLPYVAKYAIVSIYGWAGKWCIYRDKENVPTRLNSVEKDTVVLKDVSGNYETDANLIYHIKDAKSKTLFAISNKGEVVIPKFDSYTKHCIEDVIKETIDKQGINSKFIKMVNYSIPGMTIEMIKEIIDTMNSVNLNVFQFPLHNVILDDMTFHANGRVYDFSNIEMDAPITQNQFEELVNYARDRGVEILCDSIRVLTHANRLLDLFPELRYGNSHYDLNFSDKDAINVALAYAEKYASFAASVGCRYFHLDGDEFGIVPSHNRPYPEGYKYLHDRGEYDYMYLINKLSFMLKRYNMISLVWNDPVCVNGVNYPRLSDDIIVDYWENGNGMGGSPIGPKIIEDNGYKMINSKQELYWTYAEGGPKTTLDVIANYNPYKMAGGLICKNVIGCKMNVWGDGATASDARYILDTTLPLVNAYGNRLLNLNL